MQPSTEGPGRLNKRTPYLRTSPQGHLLFRPCLSLGHRAGHSLTGNVQHHRFPSELLEETLDLWVYLPPGFSARDSWRYPTLYLHDGQNVFDQKTAAFGVEWGVDEQAEHLILQRQIEPLIIVGVANTPARIANYTPFADPVSGGGSGPIYREFLCSELRPWLESQYPLRKSAEDRALAGSSLGGLSSLYISWTRPEVFGKVAAISPSLWWGERKLITRIGGDQSSGRKPSKIWLDMGDEESQEDDNDNGVPDVIDDLRTLKAVLLDKGYRLGENFAYQEIAGGRHDEASWAARVDSVLKFLFPLSTSN